MRRTYWLIASLVLAISFALSAMDTAHAAPIGPASWLARTPLLWRHRSTAASIAIAIAAAGGGAAFAAAGAIATVADNARCGWPDVVNLASGAIS